MRTIHRGSLNKMSNKEIALLRLPPYCCKLVIVESSILQAKKKSGVQ